MIASFRNIVALCVFFAQNARSHAGLSSKRGLALISDTSDSDVGFLTSEESPIAWYYTWSPYPSGAVVDDSTVFLPLLHGLDAAEDGELVPILNRLPASATHLLTFNEPDHDEPSGGSDISPKDAAEAYLDYLVPLRDGDARTWNISHPSVTGSEKGLEWLREFNESCYEIDSENGCPTDFVSVHFYGDFAGLAGWLGALNEFYNPSNSSEPETPFWITEMALPGEDDELNIAMLNESMSYLDDLDYVEGYAWFGAFRTDDANDWTGDGVSMFDSDGGLTKLGAEYLGGEDNDFEEGMGSGTSLRRPSATIIAVGLVLSVGWTWATW